jgi:hypothetical protein
LGNNINFLRSPPVSTRFNVTMPIPPTDNAEGFPRGIYYISI